MRKRAGGCAKVAVARLSEIFDHKPAAAECADQFFPTMEKLHGPCLAVQATLEHRRQWAGALVRFGDLVALGSRQDLRLQTSRLFMLAEVDPSRAGHTGDLAIDRGK